MPVGRAISLGADSKRASVCIAGCDERVRGDEVGCGRHRVHVRAGGMVQAAVDAYAMVSSVVFVVGVVCWVQVYWVLWSGMLYAV